mgnify:CR=1 FL=1
MHTTLILLTYGVIILSGLFIIAISLGINENTNLEIDNREKVRPWGLLWLIPLLGVLFLFAKTSRSPDLDEIAKTSTEKWHTVYTNNINADVTVATDDITLNPNKPITRDDKEKLFTTGTFIQLNLNSNTVTITATNKNDSTSKNATLTDDNFIEKWQKGSNPDKSKGRITKIEYRSTPINLKWFGMTVEKISYDEARITVEYDGTKDSSTKQLFGEK